MKVFSLIALLLLVGCQAPLASLTFPYRPLCASGQPQWFDVNHDGKNDFAITFDKQGRVDALCYDDDEDGKFDRIYHLKDYPVDERSACDHSAGLCAVSVCRRPVCGGSVSLV